MKKKPNIILYLVDDLGYGDISCLNENGKIHTENVDRMAEEGISFTDAHASSSVCTPSRYGLLTGRYNWRSRIKQGVLPGCGTAMIEEGRLTLGSLLQKEGYRTAAIGKWHLGMDWETTDGWKCPTNMAEFFSDIDMKLDFEKPIKNGPNTRGFDYFYGMAASLDLAPFVIIENDRIVTEKPDRCIGIRNFEPFIPGNIKEMHTDYGPASPDFEFKKVVPMMHNKVLELVDEYAKSDEPFFIYSPTPAVHGPLVPADEYVGKSGIGPYGDFVLQVDDFIGALDKKLNDLGIADNTIVIFTSDNGCAPIIDIAQLYVETGHNPSHVFRGTKFDIWEGGHRIPLIIKWPAGIEGGQISDQIVCLTDIFSTVAEIVGCAYGDDVGEDSVSLVPILKGKDKPVRGDIIHHSGKGMYSIRKDNWKLELCAGSGGTSAPAEGRDDLTGLAPIQLYNLDMDIGEQDNLQAEHSEMIEILQKQLAQYIIAGRSTPGAKQKNSTQSNVWPGLAWMNL